MEELVKRAKRGDKDAFAGLYEQIYVELYRYARYMLNSIQDAEDAVSETIVDAYNGISRLRNDKLFKSWIFKILFIKCKCKMAEYCKDNKNLSLDSDVVTWQEEATEMEYDEWVALKLALNELSFEERCIITYNIIGGYNSREIAKILDINRNTVRSKMNRALDKIRLRMED